MLIINPKALPPTSNCFDHPFQLLSNVLLSASDVAPSDEIIFPPQVPSFLNEILSTLDFSQHPISTALFSYCLVTAADMVPFVPCQPLAIALGAKLGFSVAFPISAMGQTTAGILAFSAARKASNSEFAKEQTLNLSDDAQRQLQEFRNLTNTEEQGDATILLALIGLRIAPFFPFSAGNYLLGGTTTVPLRLFFIATFLGCLASNVLSVTIGAGGAILFSASNQGLFV
jgi:uncharacterized membrane protein YdjX (TVP38/TMEM64 family)